MPRMEEIQEQPIFDGVTLDETIALLDEDTLVLTVNKRLAGYLHRCHAEQQAHEVWETPQILPLNGWLLAAYHQLMTGGVTRKLLLSANQEALLWELVVEQWNDRLGNDERLLRPASAAASTAEAWKLLHD